MMAALMRVLFYLNSLLWTRSRKAVTGLLLIAGMNAVEPWFLVGIPLPVTDRYDMTRAVNDRWLVNKKQCF